MVILKVCVVVPNCAKAKEYQCILPQSNRPRSSHHQRSFELPRIVSYGDIGLMYHVIQKNPNNTHFEFIKTKLKSIALSSFYGYDIRHMPLNISKAELSALNNLSRNKNIVVMRPDKGNGVVILNRDDYINKVLSILDDPSKFCTLESDVLDICQRREGKLMRFLRDSLLKKGVIPDEVYRELYPSGSTPGVLYGLPKVHKDNCPTRPILSAIGTYNYKLTKFLVPLLQPFASNQYTVTDSFSFAKEISSFHNNSFYMASFDVSSLFTCIPLDEVIDMCVNLLFDEHDTISYNDCKFNRNNFRKLLTFAVKENHFLFNGKLYDQVDGVAMGSPLGPSLANIFMSVLETKYLNDCPSYFKPFLYRRYVDDTFCLFKDSKDVDLFLDFINKAHPNIHFTVEVETCQSLPFLDVHVTKTTTGFSTSLFRKKTFTGLFSDFSSLSPKWYKTNLIYALVFRAFHICSSYENFHAEIVRIKSILHKNCFPGPLIDSIIRSFLNKQFNPESKLPKEVTKQQTVLFILPFLGSYSIRIKTSVSKLFKKYYPDIKIRTVFQSPNRLSSYFRFKDRPSSLVCSNVIYNYTCSSCCATYYGKTSRNLKIRCLEHLGINKSGRKINTPISSAIREHIKNTGHDGSLDDFKIISKSINPLDLLIFESLLILKDRPSLNSQQSSIPLVLF